MFIDRQAELQTLEAAWTGNRPELIVVHGRRRVGKSALLARFVRGKSIAYHAAAQQLERDQLRDLGRALAPLLATASGITLPLAVDDWDSLFELVAQAAARRRTGLVLDEFPYLVDANPGLPSLIQRWWDQVGSRSNVLLVLAGSQQAMMRHLVSREGALYGRPTTSLHIRPFDYFHAGQFVRHWSPADRIRAFAVAGGVPDYLEEFDPGMGLRQEVERLTFSPRGRLFREAHDLLRSEFTEPRTYESVLRAMAQGSVTPGTIAAQAGLSGANRVGPYLERLIDLELVERRVPPIEQAAPRPRISQYVLADHYLRFYFGVVDRWRSAIEVGQGRAVLDALWPDEFDRFVSRAFEDVARQYVWRISARSGAAISSLTAGTPPRPAAEPSSGQPAAAPAMLPPLSAVGYWWFDAQDIDVVGVSDRRVVMAGSAKWTRQFMKPGDLDDLRRSVQRCAPGATPRLYLFSRSGFDRHLSTEPDVVRVSLRDLFRPELEG